MASFGSLGGTALGIDKSRFMVSKVTLPGEEVGERGQVAVLPGQEAQVAQTEAIKAAWPRCGDAHKYLYKFANGREICTQGWRKEFYTHVMLGTIPHESLFDPAKRQEAGLNPIAVIKDSGDPSSKVAVWQHPLFIPAVAVGVGVIALLLILRNR